MTWGVSWQLFMKPEHNCDVSPRIVTHFFPTQFSSSFTLSTIMHHFPDKSLAFNLFRLCLLGITETGIRWSRMKRFQILLTQAIVEPVYTLWKLSLAAMCQPGSLSEDGWQD